MSIATLKRKTAANYNNASVGYKQFSLNGGYRNQGYVGQPVISRSLPRTLMRGGAVRGHGGCCGTYKVGQIIQSGLNYQENPNVVKSSVINNAGMLVNKYECIRETVKYIPEKSNPDYTVITKKVNIVKPDATNNSNTQGDYIAKISRLNICEKADTDVPDRQCPPDIAKLMSTPNPYTLKLCTHITKTDKQTGIPNTQGDYIAYLVANKCHVKELNPPQKGLAATNNTPFACRAE